MSISTHRLQRSATPTPAGSTAGAILRIACGQTTAVTGPDQPVWLADNGFSGTTNTASTTNSIDRSGVTNPAPLSIYQSERWGSGAITYTLTGLTPGNPYGIRLHFTEVYYTSPGQRVMTITVNGAVQISNFDIFASAGGSNKAVVRQVTATANTGGTITLVVSASSSGNDPKICGIELSGNVTRDDTPANLTASPAATYVTLSWNAPVFPTGTVTGYNIYQGSTKLNSSPITTTSYKPGQDSPALAATTQYTFTVRSVVGGVETGSKTATTTTSAVMSLLFEDTFAGSTLDLSKWVIETHNAGANNHELQYYGPPNAFTVANNTLTISARRDGNGNWYSGRIHMVEQYALLYGKMEAELKLPSIKGAWPAFWSWAVYGGGWPGGGEIDTVEAVNAESRIYSTLHFNSAQMGGHGYLGPHSTSIDITQWHTYAAEVRPGYVEFFIDGVTTRKWTQSDAAAVGGNWPFGTVKQGITLNLAVGGDWPQFAPDASVTLIEMQVRNVRIYP